MSKSKNKPNIFLRIAGVLLLLVVFTTGLASGMYARYTGSSNGSDNARVARFDVSSMLGSSATYKIDVPAMKPGDFSEVSLKVKNNSEVAVKWTIKAVNEYDNLPLEFTINDASADENTAFSATQAIKAGETEYKLKISWPEASDDYTYQGKVDSIVIEVSCEQID